MTPSQGWVSIPKSFVSVFVFYIFSYLVLKRMGWLSGCLVSSACVQKLFCGSCSTFKWSFDEFVGEKVVSLSFSSTILGPPPFSLSCPYQNCLCWMTVPVPEGHGHTTPTRLYDVLQEFHMQMALPHRFSSYISIYSLTLTYTPPTFFLYPKTSLLFFILLFWKLGVQEELSLDWRPWQHNTRRLFWFSSTNPRADGAALLHFLNSTWLHSLTLTFTLPLPSCAPRPVFSFFSCPYQVTVQEWLSLSLKALLTQHLHGLQM